MCSLAKEPGELPVEIVDCDQELRCSCRQLHLLAVSAWAGCGDLDTLESRTQPDDGRESLDQPDHHLVALEAVQLQEGEHLGVDEGRLVEDIAVLQDVRECIDLRDFVQLRTYEILRHCLLLRSQREDLGKMRLNVREGQLDRVHQRLLVLVDYARAITVAVRYLR